MRPTPTLSHRPIALLPATVALAVVLLALLPAAGRAQSALSCLLPAVAQKDPRGAAPLQFGIYPGGGNGSIAGKADPLPERPALRNQRLAELKGSKGLGVHVYTAYTGNAKADEGNAVYFDSEIAHYTAAGIDVELVIRYQPASGRDVAGYVEYLRSAVRRYGRHSGFTSLQVTNEANLGGQADASDGAFDGVIDALVQGVIGAKAEVARSGHRQVRIGFNWASDVRRAQSNDFFAALRERGGSAFAEAVDWVGVDSYPGTFFPEIALSALVPSLTGTGVTEALRNLRGCLMPLAGIGASTPIHVSENGFPTGTGRSYAMQAAILDAMVRAVDNARATYNVTDYNWFDLRDSRTDDPSFESQYGITQDDYTPKPAFGVYRDLIAELGVVGHAPTVASPRLAAAATCVPSPVKVRLPTLRSWRLHALRVTRGGRTVKRVGRRTAVPRSVSVRLAPGRAKLAVRVHGRQAGKARTRLVRKSVVVCGVERA